MSGVPARRRAAALETARPGGSPPAAAAARPLAAANPAAGKALTKEELAAYAQQRKAEREREREERAAQLRAAKLAAAHRSAADSAPSSWNPATSTAPRPSHAPLRSQGSQGHTAAGSGITSGSVSGGREGRRSISSAEPHAAPDLQAPAAAGAAAAAGVPEEQASCAPPQQQQQPPLQVEGSIGSLKCGGSAGGGGKWSPRKLSRSQQQAPPAPAARPGLPAKPRSRPGTAAAGPVGGSRVPPLVLGKASGGTAAAGSSAPLRSARAPAPPPAAATTARPAAAGRPGMESGAELDSAELEAQRTQRLVDWGALLVQTTAVLAAERLLLGPAAPPDAAPPLADELPLSYGVQPPAEPAARCAALQAQVAAALEALEQQRQLKLELAATEGLPEAERLLLEAEAAADLQAQALLAHWGTQAACDARAAQDGHA